MDVAETLQWSHEALAKLQVPHALIGGLALSEYGYGRFTQDVDWLIPEEHVSAVLLHFTQNGFQVFNQSEDVLQLSGKGTIDFLIAKRPISRAMIEDASYSSQLQMPVVKVEDLIGLKIQAYSNNPKRKLRDLADIQEMIERRPDLDWNRVKFYADHFNEWATIEALK